MGLISQLPASAIDKRIAGFQNDLMDKHLTETMIKSGVDTTHANFWSI